MNYSGERMFFDIHVHGDEGLVREAKRLGYDGICIVYYSDEYSQKMNDFRKIKDKFDIQIHKGVEITAKNVEDLRKKIKKFRKKVDILTVHGGDIKINRAASENPRVDIISHPYRNRIDCGINHVLAKKAARNNVAIDIDISYILKTRSSLRSKVLSQFREILKLNKKFNFPLIITNNAHSIYDLRTPKDIIAFLGCIGMAEKDVVKAMSINPIKILERNREKDIFIVNGVKIVK